MTDKLELKSSHEVIDTVNVADVEYIFYCKPTDPNILTVLMKDGKRLYCDEVCPIGSLQEEPVSEELEEACEQLAENARKYKAETLSPFFNQTDYKQGVIDGAKWQKSRMTKNAVEKTVGIEEWGHLVIKVDDMCVKYADKVKVIIIKEE